MRAKTILLIVGVAIVAGAAGWFARWQRPADGAGGKGEATGRRVLYFQSAMHPWIKSDRPGKCTICGMALTPVYEGERGFEMEGGLVTLGSNAITVIHVQTEEARRQPLRRSLRVAGIIEDDDTRHRILSAYADGRVDRLFVSYLGAEVVKGQPLALLYSPPLLNAEQEYLALLDRRPASPELEADHRRLVEVALQRLLRYGLQPDQVTALTNKPRGSTQTELVAPMSGTVVARSVYEGQYVKEGDRLFELADFSTMWFQFDAYERDLPWLKRGQVVRVTTPARPGKVYSAPIAFIDPSLNDPTRSAKVRVELPNPLVEADGRLQRELYHRLYAEGVVEVELPQVLAVPRTAVLAPGPQPVVYVDRGGGTYEQRRVRLGRSGDEVWEILEGVAEGESVVTSGNLLIDAQAQLNQSVGGASEAGPATTGAPAAPELPGFNDEQRAAVRAFLAGVDAVGRSLAADSVEAFNEEAARLHQALPALLGAFDLTKPWQPLLQRIEANAHLEDAADLKTARRHYLALSDAVVELVQKARVRGEDLGTVKVYQCPMLKTAFPGAPAKGRWIQTGGPLRNPYFGAEMPDCGSEVP